VDTGQLPQLIEEVVREYYVKHRPGQTFSAYWRDKLRSGDAAKVGDGEYTPPTWRCEGCGYAHLAENPPIFCPSCAGLRRQFVRLEERAEPTARVSREGENSPPHPDGFLFAAKGEAVSEDQGLAVEVAGREYAIFRVSGKVCAIDSACPHEGAQLAQGGVQNGVVTCPWHGWAFDVCTGCSIAPTGHNVGKYETKEENGSVYIKTRAAESAPSASAAMPMLATAKAMASSPKTATLRVVEVVSETPA
jgi:nitrite reductase/ring-hydroxylating ferredoxin subunit/rubredoxin